MSAVSSNLFPTVDFSRFGECDVREEIISPLLRYLGYKTGTGNDEIEGAK
jgi:hypothetical protein